MTVKVLTNLGFVLMIAVLLLVVFVFFISGHLLRQTTSSEIKGPQYFSVKVSDTNLTNQAGSAVEVEGLGIAHKFKVFPLKGTGGYVYGSTFAHRGGGSTDLNFYIGTMCEGGNNTKAQIILGATYPEIWYVADERTGEKEYFVWARKLKVSNSDGSTTEIWATFHR